MNSRPCLRSNQYRPIHGARIAVVPDRSRIGARRLGWLLGMIALAILALTEPTWAAPVQYTDNGHYYEALSVPRGLAWDDAHELARAKTYRDMPGHLATITTHEENEFLLRRLPQAVRGYYWLGGFQLPGILDPAAGWQWVTGEPFSYSHWNNLGAAEPNDYYGLGTGDEDENRLQFWYSQTGRWNDARPYVTNESYGYVVEYEPKSTSAPTITGYTAPDRAGEQITSGPPGAFLRITGANLGRAGTVLFNGIPLPATVADWSTDGVLVWVPTAPNYPFTARVTLVTGGKKAEGAQFTIAAPSPEKDNLLANASFEYPDSRSSSTELGYTYGLPYYPELDSFRGYTIPGWRIPWGTVDVAHDAWTHAQGQGRQSLDLVGTPVEGVIAQTFFTDPGRDYLFSGWMAHNPDIPEGRADVFLNGEFVQQFRHKLRATPDAMRWTSFTIRFRAPAAQTTLSLADVTRINDWEGLVLDGLSVTLAPN
jgi:hypothetical protein